MDQRSVARLYPVQEQSRQISPFSVTFHLGLLKAVLVIFLSGAFVGAYCMMIVRSKDSISAAPAAPPAATAPSAPTNHIAINLFSPSDVRASNGFQPTNQPAGVSSNTSDATPPLANQKTTNIEQDCSNISRKKISRDMSIAFQSCLEKGR